MKKTLPLLAILGTAVAYATYKLKQEEKKKIMALDQDLLLAEDQASDADDHAGCCEYDGEEDEEADREQCVEEPAQPVLEEVTTSAYSHPEYPNVTDEEYDDIHHMNEDAMSKLTDQGDVNDNERPIQHLVTFHNQEDLDNFKSKVVNKGYVVTKGVAEYDLTVLHISSIDAIKLMENVLFIADQAYANHGSYKGWQSKVSN